MRPSPMDAHSRGSEPVHVTGDHAAAMRRVGEAARRPVCRDRAGDRRADRGRDPRLQGRRAGADQRPSRRRDGDRRRCSRERTPRARPYAARTLRSCANWRRVASTKGVSLEVFIHAYRVALLAYWDACADEATRLRISREAGYALARSAIDAIDTITTQAAEAYLREENRLRTQSGRAARDLVERLIDGQPIDPGRRHPAAPGLDPTGQLLTVVGRVEQTTLAVGDALQLAGTRSRRTCRSGSSGRSRRSATESSS